MPPARTARRIFEEDRHAFEKAVVSDRKPISLGNKLNPSWCLVGPDGWTAPSFNDGGSGIEPYLPGVKNQFLRNFLWWCRNPAMNLAGFILGVEDKNYVIWASDNPLQNSGRDCQPSVDGLRWAVLFPRPQWCTAAFAFMVGWLALALTVSYC
jgi:hypothetical protein